MRFVASLFLLMFALLLPLAPIALADDANPGLLAVSVSSPRQVAPGAITQLQVDVQYAAHELITIKSSLHAGTPEQLGRELWHSDALNVTEGGDEVWPVTVTAPSNEGTWSLTAFAYYLQDGKWLYYNDSLQGPGVLPFTIKVGKVATLRVDVGIPNVPVAIGNSNVTTSASGIAETQLPVGNQYPIAVSDVTTLGNSTRFIFEGWSDGTNSTRDLVLLDGDVAVSPIYKTQYLLQLQSPVSAYVGSVWYNAGSNVTLSANSTVPFPWPLSALGMVYTFQGWSGSIQSSSDPLILTIDSPKSLNVEYSANYAPIIIPGIMVVGIIGAMGLTLYARRRGKAPEAQLEQLEAKPQQEEQAGEKAEEETVAVKGSVKFCDSCGKAVESQWTHCARCGRDLQPDSSVSSEPVEGGKS